MHILNVFFIIVIIFLLLVAVAKFTTISSPIVRLPEIIFVNTAQAITDHIPGLNNTVSNQTFTQTIIVPRVNESDLADYTLLLINKDRAQHGLAPVALVDEPSAQEHAESMLYYGYFSHWDLYGMKPYMRYTLLGGREAVTENIAYEMRKFCAVGLCTGSIDPNQSIEDMEYQMMYNDSACCNNGHRDNILDPDHDEVSIGVAYNSSAIYLVEDFINSYIAWSGNTPGYTNGGDVYLEGQISSGYSLSQIYVAYDSPVQAYTNSSVPAGPYSYGQEVAGVVSSPLYYYRNFTTIDASQYSTSGGMMDVAFSIKKLIQSYGPGEYTVLVLLNNTQTGSGFVGSSYTIFINSTGGQYVPDEV